MYSSVFDPKKSSWQVSWPERLSQHDVVYLSPPEDPLQGLPIGNGDLGALLWTEGSKLIIAVNKCDTWDDNNTRAYPCLNWDPEGEEEQTTLRHCCRVVIDFAVPVFDLLYQEEFTGRLDLAQASATLNAQTPFASTQVKAFVSAAQRLLVIRCRYQAPEPLAASVQMERWGSRVFGHWFRQVRRDPGKGLGGTETQIKGNRLIIRQKLRTLSFVVEAEVVAHETSADSCSVQDEVS